MWCHAINMCCLDGQLPILGPPQSSDCVGGLQQHHGVALCNMCCLFGSLLATAPNWKSLTADVMRCHLLWIPRPTSNIVAFGSLLWPTSCQHLLLQNELSGWLPANPACLPACPGASTEDSCHNVCRAVQWMASCRSKSLHRRTPATMSVVLCNMCCLIQWMADFQSESLH